MNNLIVIFVFSIIAYAISNHFVYAHGPMHIYDHIRCLADKIHPNLGELFQCMICFPTWVGMILSVLVLLFGTFSWLFSMNFKIILCVIVLLLIILVIVINMKMVNAKNDLARDEDVVIVLGCSCKSSICDALNPAIIGISIEVC